MRIAALAAKQYGVVRMEQLRALGLSKSGVQRRLSTGRLHRVHRGDVYSVGHTLLSPEGRWLAAVSAAGASAVLSHASAAALWDLRRGGGPLLHVTSARHVSSRRGLRAHWSVLPSDEVTRLRGIPVTTPARTLLDMAAVLNPAQLRRCVERAEIVRVLDSSDVAAVLARHPRRRGRRALADAISDLAEPELSRSVLERDFLALCAAAGLPRPLVNSQAADIEVDFHWPEASLIAEVDGRAVHGTASAFEADRARDARLMVAGFRVVRFTYRQVRGDANSVAATIRGLLRAGSAA